MRKMKFTKETPKGMWEIECESVRKDGFVFAKVNGKQHNMDYIQNCKDHGPVLMQTDRKIALRISQDVAGWIENQKGIAQAKYDADVQRTRSYIPKRVRMAQGGDSHKVYVSTDEINYEYEGKPETLVIITEWANSVRASEIPAGKLLPNFHTGLYTNGWYEYEAAELIALAKNWKEEVERKEQEQKEEKEAIKAKIFGKAKETNEKQLLDRFMVPCSDRNEECDADTVSVYAMPDGSEKTVQNHAW